MKINLEPETSKIKNRHVQDMLARRRRPAKLPWLLNVELPPVCSSLLLYGINEQ